jgi:PAS domain-containing protein
MLGALAGVAVLPVKETGRTRRLLREAGAARAEATDLNRRLQTVIDAVPAMITASDPAARYLIMNRFHAEFYGIDGDAAIGRSPSELGLDPAYEDEVRRVAAGGRPCPSSSRPRSTATAPARPAHDEGAGRPRERAGRQRRPRLARHHRAPRRGGADPAHRAPRLAHGPAEPGLLPGAAARGPRGRGPGRRQIAVHCVDLDRFKEVNDTLGHGVGDALLVAVGERMRGCLREHDTLARFGGDEFAIIQEHVAGPEEAGSVADGWSTR